jgi:site-specific DNA-methyltransferase (adenine-specific)
MNKSYCKDCEKETEDESLNDKFNSVICTECLTVKSFSKPPQEKKKIAGKTKKESIKVEIIESPVLSIEESSLYIGIEVNKVYNEKCEKTMLRMKNHSVDYIFTSPPYNIAKGVDGKKYKEYKDEMTQQQWAEWQIGLIREMLRVVKKHVFYNVQMLSDNKIAIIEIQHFLKEHFKEHVIWDKKRSAPASTAGVFNSQWEHLIIFSNIEPEFRNFPDGNFDGRKDGGMANIVSPKHNKNNFADENKAVFCIDFPRTFIKAFGKKGDVWYDPFGGSGTTAVAAIQEGRKWIISELSKSLAVRASKRIKNELIISPKLEIE